MSSYTSVIFLPLNFLVERGHRRGSSYRRRYSSERNVPRIPAWFGSFTGTENEGLEEGNTSKYSADRIGVENGHSELSPSLHRKSMYQTSYSFDREQNDFFPRKISTAPPSVGLFPEQHVGTRQRTSVTQANFSDVLPSEPETSIEYQPQCTSKHEKKRSSTRDLSFLEEATLSAPESKYSRKYWRNMSVGIVGPLVPAFQASETTASKFHQRPRHSKELDVNTTKKISLPPLYQMPSDYQTSYAVEYSGQRLDERFQPDKKGQPDYYDIMHDANQLPPHQLSERQTFWNAVSTHLKDQLDTYKDEPNYGDLYAGAEAYRKRSVAEPDAYEQPTAPPNRIRRNAIVDCLDSVPYNRKTTYVEDIRGVVVPKPQRAASPRSSIKILMDDDHMATAESEYADEF
ncbi:uncharacterized protein LOC129585658 isoform X2 [Paramacrobiotus metropolitanus]|uniref:uncharacterized protein LOC129585658 isoform X2 n=1 Tax=Paramacrobiotus metropolitanus TaxID=2943436 RepID=UPI0024458A0E|nr:uncharacterized protein LOC129585658 isoform X2 [Paramacrobiotus metropolitanus]